MMTGLLYFPYISIPDTPWLTRSLLYWDEVGSIVPYDYIHVPENLTPFMRDLVASQLVRQVFPEQYTWQIHDFEDSFIAYLERDPQFAKLLEAVRKGKAFRTRPIHIEKLAGLMRRLIRLGVARRGSGPWVDVHEVVAEKFMAYLAMIIGVMTDLQPASDQLSGLKHVALRGSKKPSWSPVRDSERTLILRDVLPVPDQIPNVDSLLRFKQDNGPLLRNFRTQVEHFLLDLEASPKPQRAARKRLFLQSVADEKKHIEELIRRQRWSIFGLGSLASLGSAGVTFIQAFASGNPDIWTAVSGGLSVLSAVAGALDRDQLQDKLMLHPLAYAVLVEREFAGRSRVVGAPPAPLQVKD
jgi:hypothetical protein